MRTDPFSIRVDDAVLVDLWARLDKTRWPDQVPGIGWEQGTELEYLKELVACWGNGFDWRARERWLNSFNHFHAEVDTVRVHFVHQKARSGRGIPLILTHGWPSSFVEYLSVLPLLTDPESHGLDGPGFDVVIPSLPGYGFSQRPSRTGVNYRFVARLWHQLMQGLGYRRYGAGGGDFGAGVATLMALDDPESLLGLHLTNLEMQPYVGPGTRPLSETERSYLDQTRVWWNREQGYKSIQSTKPQSLGYGLNDSPTGLAAWILEKWRSWGDTDGDLDNRYTRDFLLTNLMIYWVTQTITPSMRDYYDNHAFSAQPGAGDFVAVPTAIAVFAHDFEPEGEPPREWAERLYNVRQWTVMPRGGHFAPVEEPELVARDITRFFAAP